MNVVKSVPIFNSLLVILYIHVYIGQLKIFIIVIFLLFNYQIENLTFYNKQDNYSQQFHRE